MPQLRRFQVKAGAAAAKASAQPVGEGTGLGLDISYRTALPRSVGTLWLLGTART